jgi:hypothetical protein
MQEPLQALSEALNDRCHWIRIGAARVAPGLAPTGAADLLAMRGKALEESLPVDETSIVAVALAHAGGDPLGLVAKLLRGNTEDLRIALGGDYDRWSTYANERIKTGSLQGNFFPLTPFYAAWGSRNLNEEPENQELSDPIPNYAYPALYKFRSWRNAAGRGRDGQLQDQIQKAFAVALECLEAGRVADAVVPLTELALANPDPWIRLIAKEMLPPLRVDASATLLAVLAGGDGPRPDGSVFRSIAEESGEPAPRDMTPDSLAAFLAGEALEGFTDTETVFGVVNAAIAWQSERRARAIRVVARMSASAALPALVWCALNLPSTAERDIAADLLNRIVRSDPGFGIRLHRVGSQELTPGQLDWLTDIVSEGLPERIWMSDLTVCDSILGSAIAAIPDIAGEAGYLYSEPLTAQRATAFTRSISALSRLFGGGALPAEVQSRHPQVTFPALCKIGEVAPLVIQLLLTGTDSTAPPFDVSFPKGQDAIDLLVLLHAPGFQLSNDKEIIRVPRGEPSDMARFELRANVAGEQAIDIKFMLGTSTIGHCCVVTRITTDHSKGGEATVIPLDQIDDDSFQLHEAAQAVIRVTSQPNGTLDWSLLKYGTELQPLGSSPASFGPQEAAGWVKKQGPMIQRVLQDGLSLPDMAGVLSQLAATGYGLFAQIAPPTVAAELDSLQENALVVVDSDADWIPWELLTSDPKQRLWGERFVLVRAPVMTKPPNAIVAPPSALPTMLAQALLVIGDKIDEPDRLARRTFRGMAKRAEPPLVQGDWPQLCAAVTGKDIVHFTCHGRSYPAYHLSFREGIGGRLLPGQAHALGLKWGAVVFANACSSGATDMLLAEFQSFGREFYYAGARPFIGTLGPVRQEDAVEFAQIFYEQFAFTGLPAGQALRRAKAESAKRFKRPIWLFYCLYGNPSVVRRWSPS